MKKLICRTTGLFGVGLLALTACGGDGDEATSDDETQETPDSAGAEGQGDSSGEAAGEASEDGNEGEQGAQAGDDPGEESSEAPELEEIEEDIWESSTSQESVTITGQISAAMVGLESPEPGDQAEDEDTEDAEAEAPAEVVDFAAVGNLGGDGSIYQMGDSQDYVIFDQNVYQSVDSLMAEYEDSQPEDSDTPNAEVVREAFEAEGSWVNWGAEGRTLVESPAEFIMNFRDGFLQTSGAGSFSEAGLSGETDTQDGQQVWVYRTGQGEDFFELVVLADENEPLLLAMNYEVGDEEFTSDFSDWNETDEPAEPTDDEVIEAEDVEGILQSIG